MARWCWTGLSVLVFACSANSGRSGAASNESEGGQTDVAAGTGPGGVNSTADSASSASGAVPASTQGESDEGRSSPFSSPAISSSPDGVNVSEIATNLPTSDASSSVTEGTVTSSTSPDPGGAAPVDAVPEERDVTPVPTARGEHGVGLLNREVYILGGFTPTVTSSVQAYSPDKDTWRDVADFPVVFHHPNVASVDGKLYVLGFHAGSGQRKGTGASYAYDPDADAWSAVTPMPPGTERGASCVTTYQGKVYVFGGTNDIALPDASTYEPATDQWETLPFLPAMRHHCVAAEVNGKIYIVSGRDVIIEEVQAESYVFDPATRKYSEVAPILTPRGGAAGALLGGKIYVFGGEGNVDDPHGIFHQVEVYDPAADSWAALPDMTLPRHGFGAAVIDDKIYLPAGSKSQGIDVVDVQTSFAWH